MTLENVQTIGDLNIYMHDRDLDIHDLLKDEAAETILFTIFGKSEIEQCREFGGLPRHPDEQLADKISAGKGWERHQHMESECGVYAFVSLKCKAGSRCIRNIHADSYLEAAKQIGKPAW